METLALYGGKPVIGDDEQLPLVMPRRIDPKARDYITEVLDSGFNSDTVERFQKKFAQMHQSKHAVAVANCAAAIHTALAALDVGAGDEVVTTPISDFGTYAGIFSQNALPVFADIDPDTGNITAESIEKVLSPYTKAIVIVHWHGLLCDMDPIMELSKRTGIPVIEDCCQTPLGSYKGRMAGTMGTIGCFSMDAEKHLSTEHGGILTTDSKELADKAYKFAVMRGCYVEEGFGRKYDTLGLNYRYGQLEAAVGLAQLDILPEQNKRRIELASSLMEKLSGIDGIIPLTIPEGSMCLYWIFPIIFDMDRFNTDIFTLGKALDAEGIKGCSHIPYYLITDSHLCLKERKNLYGKTGCPFDCPYQHRKIIYDTNDLPGAQKYISRTVRWVWSDKYSEGDVERIYLAVKKVADYFRKG